MNNLINEMAKVLDLDAAGIMYHVMDLQEEFGEVTPPLMANSLLHTAFCYGANSEEHIKCTSLYNEYAKAVA